jgi:hypothetical protein
MNVMEKFAVLVQEMSPENLTCDGELSQSRVNQKWKKLNKQWGKLEKELGRTITEDEVWDWIVKSRNTAS